MSHFGPIFTIFVKIFPHPIWPLNKLGGDLVDCSILHASSIASDNMDHDTHASISTQLTAAFPELGHLS